MATSNENCPILQALCLLNSLVDTHLDAGMFSDASIDAALPDNFKLSLRDADTYIPVETAEPVITAKRSAIQTAPIVAKGNDKGAIQVRLTTSMTYTVSTISKPMTEAICGELLGYIWSISRLLHAQSCFTKGISISEIQHDHKGHADYYVAAVTVSLESGVWWKREIPSTILREVGVSSIDIQ